MGITIRVRVQPGASRDEVMGWEGDTLRLRLRAKAVEGKANSALMDFLASCLGLRPYQVALLRGERSREKLVEIDLPSREELTSRLVRGTDLTTEAQRTRRGPEKGRGPGSSDR